MKRVHPLIPLIILLCYAWTLPTVQAQAEEPPSALPAHCIGSGPLALPISPPSDPTFCGCTWGVVYYRGRPVTQAPVNLHFDTLRFVANTQYHREFPDYPYYVATGLALGAQRSDILTLTVPFAGETLVRPFRAWPADEGESQGEQAISLVLPERGAWTPFFTGGYTHTLTIQGQTLWAGGPAGLMAYDLSTRQATPQTLPWPDPQVRVLAAGPNNSLWAAGPHHLATWDGQQWQAVAAPFAATIRALAIHPQTGDLWVGGGDNSGALARYDGQSRQTVSAIAELITALVIDQAGGLWVGTWEGGVYYQPGAATDFNSGWTQYRTGDGLASTLVRTAAVDANSVWFGTEPYLDTAGYHGGISRYDRSKGTWQTYTTTHGLPIATELPGAPASIHALVVDDAGLAWAGTPQSVHLQATARLWMTDTATLSPITALAAAGELVIAAQADGALHYIDRTITPGQPPTAEFTTRSRDSLTLTDTLHLTATAGDQDEAPTDAAAQILAWDWQSNLDGPLCTTADECTLPASILTPGTHTLSLRVQDDEGVWSAPVTTTVTIQAEAPASEGQVYLPVITVGP
ncbi:MAG: hypothetical protein R3E79_24555 [Caldilineaceae bacterium]